MAVMGGIIGAGIFMNPYLVAQRVHTSALILAVWIAGGVIALIGGFIYAELAARLPVVGGQYAYLRDALHPAVAFMYGWVLLLVIQTGGMAAVAVTFARYFLELTSWQISASLVAAAALALLTAMNCLGVRAGSRVQSTMTLTAVGAIGVLVVCSFSGAAVPSPDSVATALVPAGSIGLLLAFGAAMTPVLFAYGGWQTSSFLAGEVRDPQRISPARPDPRRRGRDRRLYGGESRLLRARSDPRRPGRDSARRHPRSCARCSARAVRNSSPAGSRFPPSDFSRNQC